MSQSDTPYGFVLSADSSGSPRSIQLSVGPNETVSAVLARVSAALLELGVAGVFRFQKSFDPDGIFTGLLSPDFPIDLEFIDEEPFDESVTPYREPMEFPTFRPDNLDDLITSLMDMGAGEFTPEQCERALRMAFFSLDRAAVYLFDGIPDEPEGFIEAIEVKEEEEEEAEHRGLKRAEKEDLRRLFIETGIDYPELIQYFIEFGKNYETTLDFIRSQIIKVV
jgi:hypothetical protein